MPNSNNRILSEKQKEQQRLRHQWQQQQQMLGGGGSSSIQHSSNATHESRPIIRRSIQAPTIGFASCRQFRVELFEFPVNAGKSPTNSRREFTVNSKTPCFSIKTSVYGKIKTPTNRRQIAERTIRAQERTIRAKTPTTRRQIATTSPNGASRPIILATFDENPFGDSSAF